MDERRTRIVATLGPASSSEAALKRLVRAGIDVARINFSHSSPDEHRVWARRLRTLAARSGRPVGLLVDLRGPKPRLGTFDGPVHLKRHATVTLTPRGQEADPARGVLPVAYRHLPEEVRVDDEILIADGQVRVRVQGVRDRRVKAKVVSGGSVSTGAGVALPDASVARPALTAEDRRAVGRAAEIGADFLAVSFVRRGKDLVDARRLLRKHGCPALVVAKIETAAAVRNLDEIVSESDALMVARGDLGVEMPQEDVPLVQKRVIDAANAAGKPVITATEMLESMRTSTRPTRAEASDVANAVLDGSWAVMLSAETAVGRHPHEAVRVMARIARRAERHLERQRKLRRPASGLSVSEGVASAAAWIAFDVGAEAIVALTRSGATARQIARFSPTVPVFGYTPDPATGRRMTLFRGVTPRQLSEQRSFEKALERIARDLKRHRDVRNGDLIVLIGGDPKRAPGGTNRLVVHEIN
jgi:pyruvate kinase